MNKDYFENQKERHQLMRSVTKELCLIISDKKLSVDETEEVLTSVLRSLKSSTQCSYANYD